MIFEKKSYCPLLRSSSLLLEQACASIGRDPSEIRRSVQFSWDGRDRPQLIEQCGTFLEQGITEQVIYVPGIEPLAHAHKVAEALPELRKLQQPARELP